MQKEKSRLESIVAVDFSNVQVIQIGLRNQREANGWSGVDSNGHDAGNGISVGVGFTTTASLSKENIQDKVMHAPNGDDWFSSLDNRDRIGEEERWEFNDIFSERKNEIVSYSTFSLILFLDGFCLILILFSIRHSQIPAAVLDAHDSSPGNL
ncbi:hypothetical protein Cni_G19567 [Canna indica]|uniref:Uncharacterized protein n=1 Tax=Canna indica TaxID=4628 RepID=A0AAQ3KPQ6_9LILI|nr:hypothetical protein Cni_G19567 [Canna indica]